MLLSGNRPRHWFLPALLLIIIVPARAATLRITIEDEHAKPVAARVYLLDGHAQPIFPPDTIRYEKVRPDGISERHFVPVGGAFTVDLPTGVYQLTVERGKECLPETLSITVPGSGEISRTIRLRRWIDMASKGWFSGDMHVHRGLSVMPVLMESEDLALAVPISLWKTNQSEHRDPDLDHFLALSDADGIFHAVNSRFFPVLNEELEPRASALLASGLGRNIIGLDYPLARFGRAVRQAGGISDSEKPTSLELPALAAVGAIQTIGLVNNHIWREHSFAAAWGAWPDRMPGHYPLTCNGFVRSGFDMYSALLNVGFDFKLSAGSASGVHPVPPGWSRVYVKTGKPISARAWFDGVRAGRSFVTTGPMLFLNVNGREPGDAIRDMRFPAELNITVEMQSPATNSEVEVVVNGVVHPVRLSQDANNLYCYRGSLKISAESSSWIVARWVGERGNTCDAAHTSPVYVWDGTNPIPISKKEAQMLLDRVDHLIDNVRSGRDLKGYIVVDSKELRGATLRYLQQAHDGYQQKLAQLK